ncbi:hypothetical protein BJ138DRAFT_1120506 [Hygrophoropsis aurantiaca]|uniref:Uncharacterized protein n=1 Tax=Hygrophoropsis aurantiaca TaxID=72124 RepID=A0ACB7ZRK9_9AGAM|nr:hypothetical protein BJ138DRAFT_1120506 [Hygrophoropsis aurantiaca]
MFLNWTCLIISAVIVIVLLIVSDSDYARPPIKIAPFHAQYSHSIYTNSFPLVAEQHLRLMSQTPSSVPAFFEPGAPPPPLPLLISQTDLLSNVRLSTTLIAHKELGVPHAFNPVTSRANTPKPEIQHAKTPISAPSMAQSRKTPV